MFEVNIVQVDRRWLDPWLNVQTLRWLWDVFWTHDCFFAKVITYNFCHLYDMISLMLVRTCVWLDKIWLANAKSKDVLYVLGWTFQPCPFWQPCFPMSKDALAAEKQHLAEASNWSWREDFLVNGLIDTGWIWVVLWWCGTAVGYLLQMTLPVLCHDL